jgi:hypothetical protein
MSRGQEAQVLSTAEQQNQTFNQNAQQSYTGAQTGVQDYENQLSQYASANPYKAGGEFETSQNKVLANTSDAAAAAAGQAMQGAAVRTGQNAAPAIAATQADEQANERTLSGQQAQQNAERISNEAAYNKGTLQASEVPASLETTLSGQQAVAGNTSLETSQKAAEEPSFLDELGNAAVSGFGALAQGLGKSAAGGIATAVGGCWIAARLWDGWGSRRTVLFRLWLAFKFSRTWHGRVVAAAYARWGERIADQWMPRSRAVSWVLRHVFEAGLGSASLWLIGAEGSNLWRSYWNLEKVVRGKPFAEGFTERDISNHVLKCLLEWHAGQKAVIKTAGGRFIARVLADSKGAR